MDRVEINAKVIAIVARILKIQQDTVNGEATIESLGGDSLNRVQYVMELEEAFGIEISDEDAEKLVTVDQTVDYIQQNIAS